MELFNKLRNQRLEWVQELVQELNAELDGISLNDLRKYLRLQGEDDLSFVDELLPGKGQLSLFQHPTPSGEYLPLLEEQIPVRPQDVEIEWLNWILSDPRIDWFLDPNIKEKLLNILPSDHRVLTERLYDRPFHNSKRRISAVERSHVRTIFAAIDQSRPIMMNYKTNAGDLLVDKKTAPVKLEYDPQMDSLYLLHITLDDTQLHKAKLSRISSLTVLDEMFDRTQIMRIFHKALTRRERTVQLRITFGRSGLERTFYALAPFAKEAVPEDGYYSVTVKYYSFDEERLLRKLLSLGPVCTVVSPHRLRERVVHIARESLERYRE